jgi:hypothetical protein
MNQRNVADFLLQGLESELGGVKIYETALKCAQDDELREEWENYLEQTEEHAEIYTDLLVALGFDIHEESPGRELVRRNGENMVQLMLAALGAGDDEAAELVAAECVVSAEEKCNLNWELVGELGLNSTGADGKRLREAHAEVEQDEREHLYHTKGWARELWIRRLGMPAVLPPPEEVKEVKTAIGAERARMARTEMF